jgi:hypothetical protein
MSFGNEFFERKVLYGKWRWGDLYGFDRYKYNSYSEYAVRLESGLYGKRYIVYLCIYRWFV